jgi:hypothetical protein
MENNLLLQPLMGKPGDNNFDKLGYGCDVTAKYLDNMSTLSQVIDVEGLQAIDEDNIFNVYIAENDSCYIAGEDASSYTSKLSKSVKASVSIPTEAGLFSSEVNSGNSSTNAVSSKFSYGMYDEYVKIKHLKIQLSARLLCDHVTPKFKKDLTVLTMDEIVLKYGTHVYTDIILGGKLHVNYKANVKGSSKEDSVTSGFSVGLEGLFGTSLTNTKDTKSTENSSEQSLNYRTIGGNPGFGVISQFTFGSTEPKTIYTDLWSETVNDTNMQLIEVGPESIIPISEFVSDPTQKALLEAAAKKYVDLRRFNIVHELLRYFNGKDHFYTTSLDELGTAGKDNYSRESFLGFIYPENATVENLVPLYRYFNGKDHFYTNDFGELGNGAGEYKLEGVAGKVYPANYDVTKNTVLANLVPLYRYFNGSTGDHFYTTNFAELGDGKDGYVKEGGNGIDKAYCYLVGSAN